MNDTEAMLTDLTLVLWAVLGALLLRVGLRWAGL